MVYVFRDRAICLVNLVVGMSFISVGPATFHLYGFLIGLGVLAAAEVAERVRRKLAAKDKEWREVSVWDSLIWVVAGGLIGARLYHVIDWWDYYWLHPGEIIMLWRGGLGIFGGILGGVIGLWIYSRSKKKLLMMLDLAGLGLPLGQAIGRWGNYFNQELYGLPFDSAQGEPPFWAIYIKPENRLLSVIDFERFHPLFLYESLWMIITFIIIIKIIKNNKLKIGSGMVFATYLGFYGFGRFFLEWLRIEAWLINGVNVAQAISLGLILSALGFIMWRK